MPGSFGLNNTAVTSIFPSLVYIPGVGIPGQVLALTILNVSGDLCMAFNDMSGIQRVDFSNNAAGMTGPYVPQAPSFAGYSPWYYDYSTYAPYYSGLPPVFSPSSVFQGASQFCVTNGAPSNYKTTGGIIIIVLHSHGS